MLLLDAGANVNARNRLGNETLMDFELDDHPSCIVPMSRRVAPILLRAGAGMAHLKGPPFHNPYLQKIHDAGGFKAYEKQHAAALVATFASKFPVLPPEMVRHVVFFWAHVGFY